MLICHMPVGYMYIYRAMVHIGAYIYIYVCIINNNSNQEVDIHGVKVFMT